MVDRRKNYQLGGATTESTPLLAMDESLMANEVPPRAASPDGIEAGAALDAVDVPTIDSEQFNFVQYAMRAH